MRLCSYTVVHDTGFAPNPFGGVCTLAACTPNHQNVRLTEGDWLVGLSSVSEGSRLIYAMRLTRPIISFDEYHSEPAFARKKPRFDSGWQDACGDNIYHRSSDGTWIQERTLFHRDAGSRQQDTDHPHVYVSRHYYYFGENAVVLPDQLRGLIRGRQGTKCSHPDALVLAFVNWLESEHSLGVHGNPRDLDWARSFMRREEQHASGC